MLSKTREGIITSVGDNMSTNLSGSEKNETTVLKTTKDGIPLVPQPSDDPEDPLVRSVFVSSAPSQH